MKPNLRALALALAALSLAGCASRATMDARYDASLQHWKGATRAELLARWGKPMLETIVGGDPVLTWVVHNDFENRGELPVYSASPSPTAPLSHVTVSGMTSVAVPITCTTHFVLKNDRVVSWTFEGLGCGAPE
jgi:hypothetical protein